jgi:hypothetical protein
VKRQTARSTKWAKAHPKRTKIKAKISHLKTRYGISLDDYQNMLDTQKNCCAVCFTALKENAKNKNLVHVDHCHEKGGVRGILCRSCNLLIGHASDDVNILRAAIKYLEGHA